MSKIKHFRCPKCKRVTSAINLIPKCKCSGKGESVQTKMEEIK